MTENFQLAPGHEVVASKVSESPIADFAQARQATYEKAPAGEAAVQAPLPVLDSKTWPDTKIAVTDIAYNEFAYNDPPPDMSRRQQWDYEHMPETQRRNFNGMSRDEQWTRDHMNSNEKYDYDRMTPNQRWEHDHPR